MTTVRSQSSTRTRAARLLARDLGANVLIIAIDVDATYLDFGLPTQHAVGRVASQVFAQTRFAPGSMGPKVDADCSVVHATGQRAVIGSLEYIEAMLRGDAGTKVSRDVAHTL